MTTIDPEVSGAEPGSQSSTPASSSAAPEAPASKMTFIVIGLTEASRATMTSRLNSLGAEAIALASLGELPDALQRIPVCGILLELLASIKASPLEKQMAHDLLELYPLARFKLAGSEILLQSKERTLELFVSECLRRGARTARRSPRINRHLAVYLSPDDTFDDAERVVTCNISQGGCFLYSAREWTVGERVWLRFFGEDAVATGTVCSWRPWGNDKLMPGIGVRIHADASRQFGSGVCSGAFDGTIRAACPASSGEGEP
jgi:hypothetical protein